MTNKKSSVAVVGAGISGLTGAYALRKAGIETVLYEQGESVGGVIRSQKTDGWLTELGPNTMMVRSRQVWDFLQELDLEQEILEADKNAGKRYILRDDGLIALPSSLIEFLSTNLISAKAKLRLFKEPFISAQQNDQESIADFVSRRLGQEVLDYAFNPFVAGIFAGDPKKLSLKHTFTKLYDLEKNHGSLFKGMIKARKKSSPQKKGLISFREGLQALPLAIHEQMENSVMLDHQLVDLSRNDGQWHLAFENGRVAVHDAILLTTPTYTWPAFLNIDRASKLRDRLAKLPHAPMSIVYLGYKKDKITHPLDGFGMLIPEVENRDLLGTLFSSSLFPGRAPEGFALLTSFIGGSRQPEMAGLSSGELMDITHTELQGILGITGSPDFIDHHYWKSAIPQYGTGYEEYLKAIRQIEKELPGFYLCGSYSGGVSVPDCIGNAFKKAEQIIRTIHR